ncbi:MAG: cation diffusion facilitator family transporter [Solirubrobacteraceae bacterium]
MNKSKESYRIQKIVTLFVFLLFIVKFFAWHYTKSVAILTDFLEYTVNVITGLIGLFSLKLSSKPKDIDHPYGYGKAEFLSSGLEGLLMIFSGLFILYSGIESYLNANTIQEIGLGIFLITFCGIINYLMGLYAIKKGNENNSLALVGTGKHLLTDTYSTVSIVFGLFLIKLTHYFWIDIIIAIILSILTLYTGYKILRKSIAGIMDEADNELLSEVVVLFEKKRRENWIDLHNLRIIKYGSILHLDCHLTIPWYFNIHEGHEEIKILEELIKTNFGESVELFIHTDGCLDFSCKICTKQNCEVRKFNFQKKINWTIQNISKDSKHQIE